MPPAAIHLPDPPKLSIIFKLAASALDLLLPPRCCRCCAKGGKPSSIQADWSRGNRIYRKWGQIRAVVSPRSLGYIAQMRYMLRFSGIGVSEVRKDVLCFPSNRLAPRGHRRSALAPRRQPFLAPLTTSLLKRYRGSSCSLSRCISQKRGRVGPFSLLTEDLSSQRKPLMLLLEKGTDSSHQKSLADGHQCSNLHRAEKISSPTSEPGEFCIGSVPIESRPAQTLWVFRNDSTVMLYRC